MACTLAPPGEYDWTVHVRRRWGFLSYYFDHLFCIFFTVLNVSNLRILTHFNTANLYTLQCIQNWQCFPAVGMYRWQCAGVTGCHNDDATAAATTRIQLCCGDRLLCHGSTLRCSRTHWDADGTLSHRCTTEQCRRSIGVSRFPDVTTLRRFPNRISFGEIRHLKNRRDESETV